jgi:hypothetical protein
MMMMMMIDMAETCGARGLLVASRCQLSDKGCVLVTDYLVWY